MTLKDTDAVVVSELEYLNNVSLILEQTPPRTIQNYMIWRFIMSRTSDMPQNVRIIRQRFDKVFSGTNAEQARTVKCGKFVNENMGFVVSKLYIKNISMKMLSIRFFQTCIVFIDIFDLFLKSLEMINNIRNTFHRNA